MKQRPSRLFLRRAQAPGLTETMEKMNHQSGFLHILIHFPHCQAGLMIIHFMNQPGLGFLAVYLGLTRIDMTPFRDDISMLP